MSSETPEYKTILTPQALVFVGLLHQTFNARRKQLLENRSSLQKSFENGKNPDFLKETRSIREGEWKVSAAPEDLEDRRVEITGPVTAKMMINAFNSGAKVFMADLEDALSPTWDNIIQGQLNLMAAVRRTLTFWDSAKGKKYKLNDKIAT